MPKKLSDISNRTRQEHILKMLEQTQEGLTVAELTERLRSRRIEVNAKTVRRDITELSRDYMIEEHSGRPARFYCSGSKDIATIPMTLSEIQTLAVALCSLSATSHKIFNDSIAKIEARFLNAINSDLVALYEKTKSQYVFLASSGQASGGNKNDLEDVLTAVRRRRLIKAINDSPHSESKGKLRTFAPLRLVLNAGIPYLDAWDIEKNEHRRLRLTRLKQVKIQNESVDEKLMAELPPAQELFGGYSKKQEITKIRIVGDGVFGRYFEEQSIHSSQELKQEKEIYTVEWKIPLSDEFIRIIASLSPHIQHVRPKEVQQKVCDLLSNGLKNLK